MYKYPLISLAMILMILASVTITPLSASSGSSPAVTPTKIETYSKKRLPMTVEQFLVAYYDIISEGLALPDTYQYIEVKNSQIRKGSPLYRSFQRGIMLGIIKNQSTDLNLKSRATEDLLARMLKRDFGITIDAEKGKALTYTRLTSELSALIAEYHKSQSVIPAGDSSDMELYKTVESILVTNFYKKESIPDAKAREIDAINGMVSGFGDVYTEYYPPADAKELNSSLTNSIVGVGITIEKVGADWVITSTIEGGSAVESGILKGDIIKKVDGKELSSTLRIEEVVSMIRGEVGSKVTIELTRGGNPYTKTLERRKVSAPNVSVESLDSTTMLVKIRMFSLDFPIEDLKKALTTGVKEGKTRLVFDLRGNPGGSIETYSQIAGLFVPSNTEINTFILRNSKETLTSIGQGEFASSFKEIGVMVDEHSASASEMLALFLKEEKNAKIFGAKTFGKGVAQQILDFSDGSSLKYTFAEWHSAKHDTSIQGVGITPDVSLVGLSEDQARTQVLSSLSQ